MPLNVVSYWKQKPFINMKKLITVVLAIFFSTTVFAQQGNWYGGGGIAFGDNYWKFAPEAGTWLKNDIQVGAVLAFQGNSNSDPKTQVSPHLYFRKWWTVSDNFGLFLGANARFVSSTSQTDVTTSQFD